MSINDVEWGNTHMSINDVRVPAEALPDPPERRRLLDWRLFSSIAVMLMMVLLTVGAWRNYELREAEVLEREHLIEQLEERTASKAELAQRIEELQTTQDREVLRLLRQLVKLHQAPPAS